MTSWNLLPWQLNGPDGNVLNTAESALATHASSSYYHLNINCNQSEELVNINFRPHKKRDGNSKTKKKTATYKYNNKSKNMFKRIPPINDTSNKSIQVPSSIQKSDVKERHHRKKKESPRTDEQPLGITGSASTNVVCESNKKDIKSKENAATSKPVKTKKHHRHRHERPLVTITDTASIGDSNDPVKICKHIRKRHRHHSEPSQTPTICENVSPEICKGLTKDDAKPHKKRMECSEDTLITANFSISNTNIPRSREVSRDNDSKKIPTKHKEKTKKKPDNAVLETKQQQQLQDIISGSRKDVQIYYVHSVDTNYREIDPQLQHKNKEVAKHIPHKKKRKHHLSRETKCKNIQHTTSSTSEKCESDKETLEVKNKKEGFRFFFMKNRNKSEADEKRKTSPSQERKKSNQGAMLKEPNLPEHDLMDVDNSKKIVDNGVPKITNRSLSVDSKSIKNHVIKNSGDTMHCAETLGCKNKTKSIRGTSLDKSINRKQRSKSEANVKRKVIDSDMLKKTENEVLGDQTPATPKKATKDKEKHHKKHHKVEAKISDVEVQKKIPKAEGVIEKIFFKRRCNNKSKEREEEHTVTNELETKTKVGTHSTDVQNYEDDEKKRKRSKKRDTHHSVDKKCSKHKNAESTETGDVIVHKHRRKSRHSKKHTTTADVLLESSEEMKNKHVTISSVDSRELRELPRKSRRKERERHSNEKHTKHAGDTSKSTIHERSISVTEHSEAMYNLTTDRNMENMVIKGEPNRIIKITKQQLEAILNQINKKHNLQQSKTLHYRLPSNEEKLSEANETRKEVSFSHLNLKPVVAYYASPTPNLNPFNLKQFDATTANTILSFLSKDKKQKKNKIPDEKSVVSEAITKKEKFQYICGGRYSTNRAVRNFAYSENIFEKSNKALPQNESSTVGFTVEGVEPPRKLNIVPKIGDTKTDLTVACVTGIDIQPKHQPSNILRSSSVLSTAAEEDFTNATNASHQCSHLESSILTEDVQLNRQTIPENEDIDSRTKKYCIEGIHKFFEEEELNRDQFAALGQDVFNQMLLYMKEWCKLSKEAKSVGDQTHSSRSPSKKDSVNLRSRSRESSVSSKRSTASCKDVPSKTITRELNKASCSKNSLKKGLSSERTKSSFNDLKVITTNNFLGSRNSSTNSGFISSKIHVNSSTRDRSETRNLFSQNNLAETKDKDMHKINSMSRVSSQKLSRSASPKRTKNIPIDDTSKRKRPASTGTVLYTRESKLPVPITNRVKSRDTSNESISSKSVTSSRHISLFDRLTMNTKRKISISPIDTSLEMKNVGGTKIPIRTSKDVSKISQNSSPSRKQHSDERKDNYSDRRVSADRSRTRSPGSTSSGVSTRNIDKPSRSYSLEVPKNIITGCDMKINQKLKRSETFLCDSLKPINLKATLVDLTHVGGNTSVEGIQTLEKITEETPSQNLLNNKYTHSVGKKQLTNVSNKVFDSVVNVLNTESTIKQRHLSDKTAPHCSIISQPQKPHKTLELPEKDEPRKFPKKNVTKDCPPGIQCSSCSINIPHESDAESEVSKCTENENCSNLEDPCYPQQIDDQNKSRNRSNSIGKPKIQLVMGNNYGQLKADETKESIKIRCKREDPVNQRGEFEKPIRKMEKGRKTDLFNKKKGLTIETEANSHVSYDQVSKIKKSDTKQQLSDDTVITAGEELDGKEIERLSNLVKYNVMRELGAANLLKQHILEDKTKKEQQLDDIIERSIATALNMRVYSVMHSTELTDGEFNSNMHASGIDNFEDSTPWRESQNLSKNSDIFLKSNQQTIQEHSNISNVISQNSKIKNVENQERVQQTPQDKKKGMLKKLTSTLVGESNFPSLESRLDNMLGVTNTPLPRMASSASKNIPNCKKSNQIAYSVPSKGCKIRKNRIKNTKSSEMNTRQKCSDSKTNIPKTVTSKLPKPKQIKNLDGFLETKNRNTMNISKIPTLIKPSIIKFVPKLGVSDISASYITQTKNITNSDKRLNNVTENLEEPSKPRSNSSANTKCLSAYEKRKLYGQQLRLKTLNSRNESPPSSSEHEKVKNHDCIYCYPHDVRTTSTESELQNQARKKFFRRPEVKLSPSDSYNSRSNSMMEIHKESDTDIPTLGCYLCTKLNCNSINNILEPGMLPLSSNSNKAYTISNLTKPNFNSQRKPPRDENIYHAYSVLTNHPNVTDVFRNKFQKGSSISLFSRESMFSCDNILPCVSPRSAASSCSMNTIRGQKLYNTKSSSFLKTKHSNIVNKHFISDKRRSRLGKKKNMQHLNSRTAFRSPSKHFFSTIEQNLKNYSIDDESISGNSQSKWVTPAISPQLKTCQNLTNKSSKQYNSKKHSFKKEVYDSTTSNPLEGDGKEEVGNVYLEKNRYKNVNRMAFVRDTKSLERTSKKLYNSKNTRFPYSYLRNQPHNGSEEDLTEPCIELSSGDNGFEESGPLRNSNDKNKTRNVNGKVKKAGNIKTKYYPRQNSNIRLHTSRDLNYKVKPPSKRRPYHKVESEEDDQQEPARYRKEFFSNQNKRSGFKNKFCTKDEDETYTIFKLDNDFKIHSNQKKHLKKDDSKECFKIFAYNNMIELDMDFPVVSSTCRSESNAYNSFLFSNREKSEIVNLPPSENTESGYGSSKSKTPSLLRKFFPRQQTTLDNLTSPFKCFEREVYVSKSNPLSRVTTFPVNTGGFSKTEKSLNDNSTKYKRQGNTHRGQRRTVFEDSSPTSDCSDDMYNQPSSSKSKSRNKHVGSHDRRPVSHLYNTGTERKRETLDGRKYHTTENDQETDRNFKIETYSSKNARKSHNAKYYEETDESGKPHRSRIPQPYKNPLNKKLEELLPYVCSKHKPLLCLKHKQRYVKYMGREYQNDTLNTDEEPCSSNYRHHVSEKSIIDEVHRSNKHNQSDEYENVEYLPFQRELSNLWQLDDNESDEQRREVLHKQENKWQPEYTDIVHRSGVRFKEVMRTITRPLSKKSLENDDQCSVYTSSTIESEKMQTPQWFQFSKNRNTVSKSVGISSRDIAVGESETGCTKTNAFERLQKQCHEYGDKVCTQSRLREEGLLKQFIDFKEIPLSTLLGQKKCPSTESRKTNSSNVSHRSTNAHPKLKILDDTQCSKEVHTLKSLREDKEHQINLRKSYCQQHDLMSNPTNKHVVYNKEACKALNDLLEHTECTKKACESLRNCLQNSDCNTDSNYNDLNNALKESDCSEETCKNLRKLLRELRESCLEENLSKESMIPPKNILDMRIQKLLRIPPEDELSTDVMRIPSEITLSRTSSQRSIKELLDLPYEENTTATQSASQSSRVPLKELLNRVVDELLSPASKNSNLLSKAAMHSINSSSNAQSYGSIENNSEYPSNCTVANAFTDRRNLPFSKISRSPGKTSLKRSSHCQSTEIYSEMTTDPTVVEINKLLKELSQKSTDKGFESLKEHIDVPKTSLKEAPAAAQSNFKHLKNLSKESKEFLQITLQKVLNQPNQKLFCKDTNLNENSLIDKSTQYSLKEPSQFSSPSDRKPVQNISDTQKNTNDNFLSKSSKEILEGIFQKLLTLSKEEADASLKQFIPLPAELTLVNLQKRFLTEIPDLSLSKYSGTSSDIKPFDGSVPRNEDHVAKTQIQSKTPLTEEFVESKYYQGKEEQEPTSAKLEDISIRTEILLKKLLQHFVEVSGIQPITECYPCQNTSRKVPKQMAATASLNDKKVSLAESLDHVPKQSSKGSLMYTCDYLRNFLKEPLSVAPKEAILQILKSLAENLSSESKADLYQNLQILFKGNAFEPAKFPTDVDSPVEGNSDEPLDLSIKETSFQLSQSSDSGVSQRLDHTHVTSPNRIEILPEKSKEALEEVFKELISLSKEAVSSKELLEDVLNISNEVLQEEQPTESKKMTKQSKEPVDEVELHIFNLDSHTPMEDALEEVSSSSVSTNSTCQNPKQQSTTGVQTPSKKARTPKTQQLIEAPSDPVILVCTNKTCNNRVPPAKKPCCRTYAGCCKGTTCKNRRKRSETINPPEVKNSNLNIAISDTVSGNPSEKQFKKTSYSPAKGPSGRTIVGCGKPGCKYLQNSSQTINPSEVTYSDLNTSISNTVSKNSLETEIAPITASSPKEPSIQDIISESHTTVKKSSETINPSKAKNSDLNISVADDTVLENPSETEGASITKPLYRTISTCTSLNHIAANNLVNSPKIESLVQITKSPNRSLETLNETVAELIITISEEMVASQKEKSEVSLERAKATNVFPETVDNVEEFTKIPEMDEAKESPDEIDSNAALLESNVLAETSSQISNDSPSIAASEKNEQSKTISEVPLRKTSPCNCPEIVSKPPNDPRLKEEGGENSSDVTWNQLLESSELTTAQKIILECTHSTCDVLKELSPESREVLGYTIQRIITSINTLNTVPEVEAEVEIPSQVASVSTSKETSANLSSSNTSKTICESIKSNDLSVLIEGSLIELSDNELSVEEVRKCDESMSESLNSPQQQPESCDSGDLISFDKGKEPVAIEPIILIDKPSSATQKDVTKSILDEPLPRCDSTESQELSNITLFQNLVKPSAPSTECINVEINEKPQVTESVSGTSNHQGNDSTIFSKNNFDNTGFPKRTELLLILHKLFHKNITGSMKSKSGSKKLKNLVSSPEKTRNKEETALSEAQSSGEIPEELLKQLGDVSIKTMMKLYDKVSDNKEMNISFNKMVKELCRNTLNENQMSGTATQSQLNIIELLKLYTGDDTSYTEDTRNCPCRPCTSSTECIQQKDVPSATRTNAKTQLPKDSVGVAISYTEDTRNCPCRPCTSQTECIQQKDAASGTTTKVKQQMPNDSVVSSINSSYSKAGGSVKTGKGVSDLNSLISPKESPVAWNSPLSSNVNVSDKSGNGVPDLNSLISPKDSAVSSISPSNSKAGISRKSGKGVTDLSSLISPNDSVVSSNSPLNSKAGVSLKSGKGITNLNSLTSKAGLKEDKNPLKVLKDSLTDKELFEKLLDSYEKEEKIVEKLSDDDEFFQSQLDSVKSKESIASLLLVKEKISKGSDEELVGMLNLDSFSSISSVTRKKKSVKQTSSITTPGKRTSKMSGFTSKVSKYFKSDDVKEIVAPRADSARHSVDMSYLGFNENETDDHSEKLLQTVYTDEEDEIQNAKFSGRNPFEEDQKNLEDVKDVKALKDVKEDKDGKGPKKKSVKQKPSKNSDCNAVEPSDLGKCFLRGFRSDYVSLGGDTCLLISNQEKEQQSNKHEAYIEFSERDTPLEYLLALGFSIDEASNAIKDEDVQNRLFAAIIEARIWINQITTVQGTLLYLIAYKAKPRIMRYYLQLVEAIINRRIQNAVKLDAFLRVLEKVEDGDLTLINIIGSDKFADEENEEKVVKNQLRQLFIKVYNTAENEARLKNKPLAPEGVVLLRILAAKYRAGLHPHLELIARYIGQGLLRNEVQLEAAMIYLSRLDTADVNLEEFELYCGITCKETKLPGRKDNPK